MKVVFHSEGDAVKVREALRRYNQSVGVFISRENSGNLKRFALVVTKEWDHALTTFLTSVMPNLDDLKDIEYDLS